MMVWCELHGQDSRGGGQASKLSGTGFVAVPLNFEYGEYESDFERLRQISQDDLVHEPSAAGAAAGGQQQLGRPVRGESDQESQALI